MLHSAVNLLALASIASGGGGVVTTAAEHRVLYQLDIMTGAVLLNPSLAPATSTSHLRPAQVFVYRPRSAKGPAVRIRLAAGQPARELAAGDYLDFSPPSDQLLQVTLLPADGPEVQLPILPTGQAALYLECRPAEALPLRQVTDAEGAAAVTRLLK